jgi:large subunit ribosomal protein L4
MKVSVYSINGTSTGREIELSDAVFGIEPKEHAVYLDVKQYLANQRQGTHKSKERSEVSGSTRKLHRQKGTGGARKGDINNPLYPGGGRVFGPKPRDYSFKLNKKVKVLARRSALSMKAANQSLFIVEDFNFAEIKTKAYYNILKAFKAETRNSCMVMTNVSNEVLKSSRNISTAMVCEASDINTYNIMRSHKLFITESAINTIVETLNK